MEYLSAKEAAEKWGITNRMVNYLCANQRVNGAMKKGNMWLIPQSAAKPSDRRRKAVVEGDLSDLAPRPEAGRETTRSAMSPNNAELFLEIFRHFPFPMHICAPDGTMLLANHAYLEFAKVRDPQKLFGKHNIRHNSRLKAWGIHDFMEQAFQGELARADDIKVPYQEIVVRLGDARNLVLDSLYQDLLSFPICDPQGELAFVVFIMVTTRRYSAREEITIGKEYIDLHWKEDFDLDELAGLVHFNKYHYTRMFKQHTGITPYQYYQERKLNKLKEKLCDQNLPLTQAFAECGLDYNGNFAKLFKKKVGMSPAQYRRFMTEE